MVENSDNHGIGDRACETLCPFDGGDAGRGEILIQADLIELRAIETIEIDVNERQASTAILMHEREGRTGHLIRIDRQPLGKSANEGCLPRSKITG